MRHGSVRLAWDLMAENVTPSQHQRRQRLMYAGSGTTVRADDVVTSSVPRTKRCSRTSATLCYGHTCGHLRCAFPVRHLLLANPALAQRLNHSLPHVVAYCARAVDVGHRQEVAELRTGGDADGSQTLLHTGLGGRSMAQCEEKCAGSAGTSRTVQGPAAGRRKRVAEGTDDARGNVEEAVGEGV